MSKAMKAALISALVLPGAGHFFLKRYFTGAVLALATLGSLSLLVVKMVERALLVVDKIQSGQVAFDVTAITRLVSQPPSGPDAYLLRYSTAVIILSWLIGIVDSYRVGLRDSK